MMSPARGLSRGWGRPVLSEAGRFPNLGSSLPGENLTLELGPVRKIWFWRVSQDRGSGIVETNEAVRKCQTAGKRATKRAKVRGHSPQEAPRISEKVSRGEIQEEMAQCDEGATKVQHHWGGEIP